MNSFFANRLFRRLALAYAVVFMGLAVQAVPAMAQLSPEQKGAVEAIVRDYIQQHPEALRDALIALSQKEKVQEDAKRGDVLKNNASAIFDSPHQTVVGNPAGTITIVEFFDYNCGYCKRAVDDLGAVIRENPDVRVVLKDFPILSPGSREVAQVAIALRNQFDAKKIWDFHARLMGHQGQSALADALAVAKELGADMAKLDADIKGPGVSATLDDVARLAGELGINGTPTFVMGDELIPGAVGKSELTRRISSLRQCGKTRCS